MAELLDTAESLRRHAATQPVGARALGHGESQGGRRPRGPSTPAENARYVPVAPHGDEWIGIEYLFGMGIRSSRAKIRKAWSLNEPHLRDAFEHADGAVLHAWIPLSVCGVSLEELAEVRLARCARLAPPGKETIPNLGSRSLFFFCEIWQIYFGCLIPFWIFELIH